MPAYTYPGVFLEETGPGPRPINGVSTTGVAFVGFAQDGPPAPTAISSFADYQATFGGFAQGEYLAHAVQGFFQNGGVRCHVLRLPPPELCRRPEATTDASAIRQPALGLLAPLDQLSDVSIVCCPDEHSVPGMAAALIAHCQRLKYRIAVLAGPTASPAEGPPKNLRSSFAAYYAPWVLVPDPAGGAALAVHPGGHIAGAMARSDLQHGVWKAPANLPVLGIVGLTHEVNRQELETLNQQGVNALRSFPGKGYLIWGARTTSPDLEWKYVNVRRYLIYLEQSIGQGTQWVVFEPNGETLWSNVRRTISDFLFNEFKNGALLGIKRDEAFFVRCDRTTMTQNELDAGRLSCLIGVAPQRPAEFIIFRIGQLTADAQSSCS
jgi:phage tail sheath protein FI